MSIKIEFYRKCFDCLYVEPETEVLYWYSQDAIVITDMNTFSDKDITEMLGILHENNNIVCDYCGRNDHLAFSPIKVNDIKYREYRRRDEKSERYFQLHNQIMELAQWSIILFHMNDGSCKIARVYDELTNRYNGSKFYTSEIFYDGQYLEEIENFVPITTMAHENIYLSEISEAKSFTEI